MKTVTTRMAFVQRARASLLSLLFVAFTVPSAGQEDQKSPAKEPPPYMSPKLNREPVYTGTFRPCSSHEDCVPDECCIYGLSRGDSCVKHFRPCPIEKKPEHPQPRFCPPYNSGGFFFNVCTAPEDCPYPYLCCYVRGAQYCVPSFYDRRRRRRHVFRNGSIETSVRIVL